MGILKKGYSKDAAGYHGDVGNLHFPTSLIIFFLKNIVTKFHFCGYIGKGR